MSTETNKDQVSVNWISKVLTFLNLTDEGKVGLQQKEQIKFYEKEIYKARAIITKNTREFEEWLDENQERLIELNQEEDDAFVNLDFTRIQTVADRKAYVNDLDQQFNRAIQAVKKQEELIEEKTKEVEVANRKLEKSIVLNEKKISKLK